MLRASVTIFYGVVFHAEGEDAQHPGPVWDPIAKDEVHEAGEAAVSAGERLGATMPNVPYDSRNPKTYALYEAWWADCKARVEALGFTFVLFGDFTDRSLVQWGVAVASTLHETESFTSFLALDADQLVVQPGWNDALLAFCEKVGIAWREPLWHIGASD